MADLPVAPGDDDAGLSRQKSATPPPRWSEIAVGFGIGAFCGWLICELTLGKFHAQYAVPVVAALFGTLVLTRLRGLVWVAGLLSALPLCLVAVTPLVPWLIDSPSPADPLGPANAVVSLGGGLNDDGTLGYLTRDRATEAFCLVRAGYAPRLILTGGANEGDPLIRSQMSDLGLSFPVENVGPVTNTHDEAVAVARLVAERHWRRVILVTNTWHMRRAAAAFRKAGVMVLLHPCPDSGGATFNPQRLRDRMRILALWLHEAVGYRVYAFRGWV